MSSRYWELSVTVADGASEGLTNFVWELGALGVVEDERPGEPPRLRAFFPSVADTADLRARLDAYVEGLRALGFPGGGGTTVRTVADEDWADAWRAHFAPRPVGRSLLIAPPWEPIAGRDRRVILIEPGRAFGTGQHGTTAGCLELLEDVVDSEAPAHALDLGTGSGILAIAAARLGVAAVLAVDSDPDAISSASANVARNGLAGVVRCALADVAALSVPPAPLVLANLLAAAHREHADRYAALVAPGGTLLAGGVLDAEATDVAAVLAARGFRVRAARSLEGWTSLALVHDAPVHGRA